MGWATRPFVTVGTAEISVLKLALFVAALVAVVLAARALGNLVGSRLLQRTAMDPGLQYAIGRFTYYGALTVGLLIALQTSGIQVGSVAVVLGALGVGIGFGLQHIVTNFVGGLILLVERPISVGDRIEVAGTGGRVARIGARSTTVITGDNITMIIPNAEFVTQRVINWSHGDPRVRIRLPVGVAYGSDLATVERVLAEVAAAHPAVLADPPPQVFFAEFGDSALNLELAVWTRELAPTPRRLRSDPNFAIDAAFRRHGITIPFPQRDLHLRSEAAGPAGPARRDP
jgi:small-conductance mechanosensitive channel